MKNNSMIQRKMKLPGFIITGAIAGVITLLFAFTPIHKEKTTPPCAGKANPVAKDAASLEAGKSIYKFKCYSCHGTNGKGNGPKCEELDKTPQDFTNADFKKQTDGDLFCKITEGKTVMPCFKHQLTKEQRWQIINYIRSL